MRFISLDSNIALEEQVPWIRSVLENNPNKWTIVTFHHPMYSPGTDRDNPHLRKLWKPLFDEFKDIDILELDYNRRHKGFRGLLALYRDIRELDPIGIVDLHGSLRTNILRLFFFFSSIRYKNCLLYTSDAADE